MAGCSGGRDCVCKTQRFLLIVPECAVRVPPEHTTPPFETVEVALVYFLLLMMPSLQLMVRSVCLGVGREGILSLTPQPWSYFNSPVCVVSGKAFPCLVTLLRISLSIHWMVSLIEPLNTTVTCGTSVRKVVKHFSKLAFGVVKNSRWHISQEEKKTSQWLHMIAFWLKICQHMLV